MPQASYQVLIVGAGQIGAFYDAPGSPNILTHAHAFSVADGFQLVGFVDVDAKKGQEAATRWDTQYFKTLEEAFASSRIDVVCVAVPDAYHYQTLQELLNYPLKLVFAEKPFCGDVEKAQEILRLYELRNVAIQVNYSRRFVPEFQVLAQQIQSGEFGECLGGTGLYGKGFIHNGSHMVNLLQFLFGNGDIQPGTVFGRLDDFGPSDPSLSLQLALPPVVPALSPLACPQFTLQAVDSRSINLFEFDLLFEKKRIRMLKNGFLMYYFDTAENETFAGYRNYIVQKTIDTGLGKAFAFAVENIRQHLDHSAVPLVSTAESAIATLDVLSKVVSKESICR